MRTLLLAGIVVVAASTAGLADQHMGASNMPEATAALKGADGADRGIATLIQTPAGVLIRAELTGVPEGVHGFHIHETGSCEAPDFESAGGHFAGGMSAHGFMNQEGPHAGDMPNITVAGDILTIEILNPKVSLQEGEEGYLFDDDGSALLIHAGADDYMSQPSGDAGARIACAVIQAAN